MMKTTMMMRRKGIHNKAGLRRFLIFLWIPTMTRVRTMTLMTRMIMLEISITGWPPSIAPVVTETINKTINKIAVIMTPSSRSTHIKNFSIRGTKSRIFSIGDFSLTSIFIMNSNLYFLKYTRL